MDKDVLISVVVPAYNAAATLAETLASVAGQRHRRIEILIIDDGSTDDTADIAARFCAQDPRARLLSQPNRGVAAARNLGLREARADYVAPIDADDIWHPDHLAGLLERMRQSRNRFGFVCARYRLIDRASRIFGSAPPLPLRDTAVAAMLHHNFVGNGSAMLLDRSAALAAGGYEESLRLAGVEGCEDYLLQLRIAHRHPVAVLDAFTVGYRRLPTAMSSNVLRMIESQIMALDLFFGERGEAVPVSNRLRAEHARALGREHWRHGRRKSAARKMLWALALDPARSCSAVLRQALFLAFERAVPGATRRPSFVEVDPQARLNLAMDRARRWTSVPRRKRGFVAFEPSATRG